jgi:CBS domain-containing protein
MKVSEAMTAEVKTVNPQEPISKAAKLMAESECGAIPVGENDRLVGMVTDRDIAVRAIAQGKGSDTPIRDVMSQGICYCFEDQEINDVASHMASEKVRRLPVLNKDKRLVGILSLGDIAMAKGHTGTSGQALGRISSKGGAHSQAVA